MKGMPRRRNSFEVLAEFRYQLRRFLNFSEQAARETGVEPHQHQALLALKGLPEGRKATIGVLAERLQILHHTAVELANRLEAKGLIRRARNRADRREVILHVSRRGQKLLQALAHSHQAELNSAGPGLLRALQTAIRFAGGTKGLRAVGALKPRSRQTIAIMQSKAKRKIATKCA